MCYSPTMEYRVADFVLDLDRFEVRKNDVILPAEPQVLSVLFLLAENSERLITKDELVARVWNGRAISDSAISSRIKAARQLLGDDGANQRFIRTVHGRGFRFVGPINGQAASGDGLLLRMDHRADGRPSIAVLPFRSAELRAGIISEGLPHELIVELSRLRWLRVIARGSSFRLRGEEVDVAEAGRLLGARYIVTGDVHLHGTNVAAGVELVDTCDSSIVWAGRFDGALDEIHDIRRTMLARVVNCLEVHIPKHEADTARLRSPESIDAWSRYHLGLQHMFRFNRSDNLIAQGHFERAVAADPEFARAHAGLSFTHFQNAFLHYADSGDEQRLARRSAERAVELDELDPFANLSMGRSLWLEASVENSLAWLERATALSPSYAHAVYSTAWAQMVLGRAAVAETNAKEAMLLSPIDPLRYAMVATSALSQLMLGEEETAAALADRAASEPNAHVLIAVIAAACQALAGNGARAQHWACQVRSRAPNLRQADFFSSFPFADAAMKQRLSSGLATLQI